MAEGGGSQDNLGQSLSTGSEFVFDFYCELCRDDGLNEEANGYCRDCGEYLCDVCIRAHRKSRPTRHHDVLDQAAMPKDTPLSQDRVSKDISTKCKFHGSKLVEYYCPSHDALGCSICFTTVHKLCAATESVYDQSETIILGQEYTDCTQNFAAMGQRSNDMIKRTRDNIETLETCCLDSIGDIRTLKAEVIAIFDELEQNLITQVETMSSGDKENMQQLEKELTEMKTTIDDLRSELEELAKSKRVCQLYIRMKEEKSKASSLKDQLKATENNIKVKPFEFAPNNDIKNAIRTSGLGKIVPLDSTRAGNDVTLVKNDKNTRATHVTDINVKTKGKTNNCYINGSVVLSDTLLVTADYTNRKVKLIDTNANKLKNDLTVSGNPLDVAKINHSTVAVSLQDGGKILIIKVTDTLGLEREISVSRDCRGVAYSQGKLLVTFYNSNRLDIMDLQGDIIKKIEKTNLHGPRHVCVSTDRELIYLSDYREDKVIRLTFDGEVKSEYKVSDPQKICTDHCGNVYIATQNNKSVHMLSADLVKIKEILTEADGLDHRVLSVSHCAGTNRLYVSMDGSNIVKVYQLA